MATQRQRVLLIAYQFPPVGGAGVQRVTKFARYLPEQGWNVSVLTVSNPSVPVVDPSLADEVPPETLIRRALTYEPSYHRKQSFASVYKADSLVTKWKSVFKRFARGMVSMFLQPDPQVLWIPNAIREGTKLLREHRHDAILVSGPPFSSFLVGAILSRRFKIPLTLDYRDEWSISNRYWENRTQNSITHWFNRSLQGWILRRAHLILATTRRSANSLQAECSRTRSKATVRCIYNGVDRADFQTSNAPSSRASSQQYCLTHVGTLWNLTSVRTLVESIEKLSTTDWSLLERLCVKFVGRCTSTESELIDRLGTLPCRVERTDYVDHAAAIRAMNGSDELLLLLADLPGAERVVPGKTFEYLATDRPILAVSPNGETQEILSTFPGVKHVTHQDMHGLQEHLKRRLCETKTHEQHKRDLRSFERKNQACELAGYLSELTLRTDHAHVGPPRANLVPNLPPAANTTSSQKQNRKVAVYATDIV